VKRRSGFTLIEVMIALLIGSVVVLLAYATLRTGLDVQDRVAAAHESDETMTTMRAMLTDAVRHARTADGRDALGMHTTVDGSGRVTALGFASRGITAPQGGADAWQVSLNSDTAGLTFAAAPIDAGRTPLRMTLRSVRGIGVRFLARDDAEWRDGWNDPSRLPAAIEIRFLGESGADVASALVARTAPVSGL
jgi:prepilin-type N-terminal cleavage/methylation domain-containing protein